MTVVVTHTTPADSTFSSTGAAAWNADHALSGLGTMAEQNKTSVDIEGGTIDNTTVGATTPSTGVFTTLTATGQTSLGGVAGSESLRVLTAGASPNAYATVQGSSFSTAYFGFGGSATNGNLYFQSKAAGTITFQTNNGAQTQVNFNHTASAVNYHQLTGSATGSGPIHSAQGSDTNIDLNLTTKGTGSHKFNTGTGEMVRVADSSGTGYVQLSGGTTPYIVSQGSTNANLSLGSNGTGTIFLRTNGGGTTQAAVAHTASAVNYVQMTGSITGSPVAISAQGSDSNIRLNLFSKGTESIDILTSGGAVRQARFTNTASTVNWVQMTGAVTGFGPVFSAAGTDTNIPLVVQPKGTGALQAQQTDSTATGGNARGANAVDWQMSRGSASQVASNSYSIISGGIQNTSSAFGSVVSGGLANTASATLAFIGGGQLNQATKDNSVIVGGSTNSALGIYNFIGGGFTNSGTANAAVTTQSGTMNATTAVTLSGSNVNIKVGQYITGTSIAGDTYVSAISGTSLTLSKVASGSSTSTLSFFTPHGVVVGGGNNQATGAYSVILGGGDAGTAANRNVASGDWSTVGGGRNNTASGVGAVIAGGGTFAGAANANVASGGGAVVSGGASNTTSGFLANISGGFANLASASGSSVSGGWSNTSNSSFSTVLGGTYGTTRSISCFSVLPACDSPIAGAAGVSQMGYLILARQTTDATATVLTSNASAASTTNQVILPNNSAYAFKGTVIANVTGGGNTKAWAIEGAIKRGANAASTALVGTPTVVSGFADVGAATWAIAVTADTTNGGLAVTFTGQAATTIRCVAKLETTEVTF